MARVLSAKIKTQVALQQYCLDDMGAILNTFRISGELQYPLPPKINSIAKIRELDLLLRSLLADRINSSKFIDHSFTAGPIEDFISDNFSIEHIKNSYDLKSWGEQQHNCVLGYCSLLINESIYMFKITTFEEKASLTIKKDARGKYQIEELLATCNEPVKLNTERYVNLWLNNQLSMFTSPLEAFPFPEITTAQLQLKPQPQWDSIINLLFDQSNSLQIEDVISDHNLFCYQIILPESGFMVLNKYAGQWEIILLKNTTGDIMSDVTYQLLEQ
jgi:hypothetical protein